MSLTTRALLVVLWSSCALGANGADPHEGLIEGLDSDFLLLRTAPSSLPVPVGEGVFAKQDIPEGTILCEYRGPVVESRLAITIGSDKGMDIGLNGVQYTILGSNICAMINDCANINVPQYKLDENGAERHVDFIPHKGYSYNAAFLAHLGKMFAVSSTDIKTGDEIFVPYGGYA